MLFLLQDGITNGAIYALLGLALVLVFAVTRVILIPQGEFVTFGALSYAVLATGKVPGTAWLAHGDGRGGLCARPVRRPAIAAAYAGRALLCAQHRPAGRDPRADLRACRPNDADRGQHRAVAVDRRGDRTVSLPHRVPAARPHLGAGAADRLRRLPSRAAGAWAGVLRRRGPARAGAVERGADDRTAALHRPEPCGLRTDDRLHRRAVAVLRLHADGQGAARHRCQPARRAPRRHPHHAVGADRLPAGVRDRRDFRNPDRADHDALLRHRLPDRPERFHRRDHRRAGELSADRGGGA